MFNEISATIEREGLEVFVGRSLNKLGISFVVIGCVFALAYQFQYFSPLLKVGIALFAGAFLIWKGETFERNSPDLAWYGRALLGGGWALTYFTVFAAYHLPVARIIDSATLDAIALLAVAAGAIFHSLKYKSQTITGLALTLAFVSVCLCPATNYSLVALAILLALLVVLCSKMRWYNLFVYGECVFYAVYLGHVLLQITGGVSPLLTGTMPAANLFAVKAFSFFSWMAMNWVIFNGHDVDMKDHNRLVISSLINCGAFVLSALLLLMHTRMEQSVFLLTIGSGYILSTLTVSAKVASLPVSCNRIIGLSLITASVPFAVTGDWVPALWALEVPFLVWIGAKYQLPSVRWFAGCVALIGVPVCCLSISFTPSGLLSGLFSFTAYGASAALCLVFKLKNQLKNNAAFYLYYVLSSVIAVALLNLISDYSWLAPGFVIGCALTVMLGFKLRDSTLRVGGNMALFAIGAPLMMSLSFMSAQLGCMIAIPLLLYIAHAYKKIERITPWMQIAYNGAASIVLAHLLGRWFSLIHLEAMLAMEAFALLIAGFVLRGSFKFVAFCACAYLSVKYFFVDYFDAGAFHLYGVDVERSSIYGIICVALLLTASAMHLSKRLRPLCGNHWKWDFYCYAFVTAIVVLHLNQTVIPTHFASLAYTVEGVSLLALGFAYREKPLRITGLFALGFVIARLLFVELASVETIYRIFSFIGAGVVMLAASLAYAKMNGETAVAKSESL